MFEPLARLGYSSKAVIYGIVGVLAILTVLSRRGAITDTAGALRVVLSQPYGPALLVLLAIGLCGYAVWRLSDAFMDPDHDGTGVRGLVVRLGNAARGCIYGALGIEAIRLLRGLRRANSDEAEMWAARILEVPLGGMVIGLGGAIIAMYGCSEVAHGLRGTHDTKLDWSPIRSALRPTIQAISRFGVATRGALIVTLGTFLIRAAFSHDPNDAAGTRESMLRLGGLIEGRWFLGLIAAGVIAYAVDQVVHARCRRIRPVL